MACGRLVIDQGEAAPEDEVAEALAVWGLKADAPLQLDDEFWIWPENEETFYLWLHVQSQWEVEDGKRYKLDYAGVKVVMEAWGLWDTDRRNRFSLIQAMEGAVLNEWARNRK